MIEIFIIALIINKTIPVVCVIGNHERKAGWENKIAQKLQAEGIIVLKNEIITLDVQGNVLNILGLDEEQKYQSIISILKNTFSYRDNSNLLDDFAAMPGYKIVLSHHPEKFALAGNQSYNQYDFDLMFAGHAHGGQFNLPFIGGVYAPGQGFNPKYYKGINDDRLIVSRGLGNSGFPLRLFNCPEIVEVTITG